MSIEKWNQRYQAGEQVFETPTPLVAQFSSGLVPGAALDLACGPGRNALYLARQGWRVTAVDGSVAAVELLRGRNPDIDARIADLERGEFLIQPDSYNLICCCYYLQRDLFPLIKLGVRPGGMAIAIVHLTDADEPEGTATRARPGELRQFFSGWKIVHDREGQPRETCHQRAVAELVAIRPA